MHQPISLRCEYLVNPLGIDARRPRLSWELSDPRRGARQSAYQIVVASSLARLGSDQPDLWNSGVVSSDQSIHIEYAGTELASRQRCYWKVRTWDASNEPSSWSEPAWWEMGLLQRSQWKAKWIGAPIVGGPYSIPPAAYLRKQFRLDGQVSWARLYVTALGLYEFEINGQPVADYVFAPGRTEYTKRVPYQVFDVTGMLRSGENACGAILGDGWYCGHLHSDPRQTYGDRPRLLAQLEVGLADGSTRTIVSDETWSAGEGPIRSSDMLMGEDYDARLEIAGWSSPADASVQPSAGVRTEAVNGWRAAVVFDDPGIELVAHRAPPVRRIQLLKPIAPPKASANRRRHIFDLGQNMVGRVRLRVRNARPGQTIELRHAEMLDKDGKLYTAALRTARATDHYTTRGGAEEIYEPRFTFHGFRYVEVRDYPGRNPTADDLVGVVVHSDATPTGQFECSDPMINQLQSNIVWSQKGNFIDIPTDCPQRDERLGWTGDAQVFIRTAAFNMDVANFFTKWLRDMADSQGEDGRIPSVVPHVRSIHDEGGPAWADAAVICPWIIYLCYGDKRILEDCWPMMSRFMDFLQANCVNDIRADEHWKWRGYGDWLSINAETPHDLIGTAFYAHCARLMSRMAGILGKEREQAKYAELFQRVRRAWQRRFVTADGLIIGQTQTAYVLALHFDLLPEELRPKIVDALVRNIESRGMHLSTGFVGTPYLNHVLTRFGRSDVAYALLMQKTYPSWLYPITQGATTMWERWDAWTHDKGFSDTGMNSFNHYAFGAVGEWIYSTIGGIDLDPEKPGYKHILIRPTPGGQITWARAALKSVHGLIESAWRIEGERFNLNVTIPPNTTATVRLPTRDANSVTESGQPAAQAEGVRFIGSAGGFATYAVAAGKYQFASNL
ncbi:glycoside hydrolase family 78 protein [Fontivita pretiosa]|uniref:glycoside hydrolase family 78 protein n=1 Tax=Fontivita pretiosa TaxID=2989684 RepID=UPI003D16D842